MTRFVVAVFALSSLIFLTGCETVPGTQADRDVLHDRAQATLNEMTAADPSLGEVLERSAGYAVFPEVGKGAFIVGGAYGRGVVYERGNFIGYADISQASVGLQAGGQSFAEVVVFMTQDALNNLRGGKFDVGANAEAVALTAGIARQARFERGVGVFVLPRGGLMAGISIQGQVLDFVPAEQVGTNQQQIQQQRTTTIQQQPVQQQPGYQQQQRIEQQPGYQQQQPIRQQPDRQIDAPLDQRDRMNGQTDIRIDRERTNGADVEIRVDD